MAVLPIYNCFHPILRKPTKKITNFDGKLKELVDNMFDTMYNIPYGVGLAGNQVGQQKSLLIIDLSVGQKNLKPQPVLMINPEIIDFSDEEVSDQEGCLSIPDYYEKVSRPESIQVKFYDLDEKEHKIEANDFFARVIQHEVDHLHGKLIFDRITPLRRTLSKSKLKRIERGKLDIDYPMIMPDDSLRQPDN